MKKRMICSIFITFERAELLLQNNVADLIGVGRPVFNDSNWAKNIINNSNLSFI